MNYDEKMVSLPSYFCMVCGARENLAPVERLSDPVGPAWWVCRDQDACDLRSGDQAGRVAP